MVDKSQKKSSFKDTLKEKYRFIIMNDDSLSEIKSYRLKLWQLLVILSVLLTSIVICTFLIISLSSVKDYLSNWGKLEKSSSFIDLNTKIEELEQQIEANQVYKKGIENMMAGVSAPQNTIENDSLITFQPSKASINPTQLNYIAPIKGLISAGFDKEKKHYGIDITAPKGTAVKSILPGSVIQAEWNPDTGNTISIQHSFNLISIYKHNSSILQEIGSFVEAGEAIAIIGNTGILTTGPHLHFELWYEGEAIDASTLINFN